MSVASSVELIMWDIQFLSDCLGFDRTDAQAECPTSLTKLVLECSQVLLRLCDHCCIVTTQHVADDKSPDLLFWLSNRQSFIVLKGTEVVASNWMFPCLVL